LKGKYYEKENILRITVYNHFGFVIDNGLPSQNRSYKNVSVRNIRFAYLNFNYFWQSIAHKQKIRLYYDGDRSIVIFSSDVCSRILGQKRFRNKISPLQSL
jgi:hypothetical protein